MSNPDRPTVPGEVNGANRFSKDVPSERKPPEEGSDRELREKAPGKASGPSKDEPLTDQPPVEGP